MGLGIFRPMRFICKIVILASLSLAVCSARASQLNGAQLSCLNDLLGIMIQALQPKNSQANIPPYLRVNLRPRDINKDLIVSVLGAVEQFWREDFERRGWEFKDIGYGLFSGSVQTLCGEIKTEKGPVYCPLDGTFYLDPQFFAQAGIWKEMSGAYFTYIMAHEFGHHIQYMLGIVQKAYTIIPALDVGRRMERQADCLSGVFVGNLLVTGQISANEINLIKNSIQDSSVEWQLSKGLLEGMDLASFMRAIMHVRTNGVHGLNEDRQSWFDTGLNFRNPAYCDSFLGVADYGVHTGYPMPGGPESQLLH